MSRETRSFELRQRAGIAKRGDSPSPLRGTTKSRTSSPTPGKTTTENVPQEKLKDETSKGFGKVYVRDHSTSTITSTTNSKVASLRPKSPIKGTLSSRLSCVSPGRAPASPSKRPVSPTKGLPREVSKMALGRAVSPAKGTDRETSSTKSTNQALASPTRPRAISQRTEGFSSIAPTLQTGHQRTVQYPFPAPGSHSYTFGLRRAVQALQGSTTQADVLVNATEVVGHFHGIQEENVTSELPSDVMSMLYRYFDTSRLPPKVNAETFETIRLGRIDPAEAMAFAGVFEFGAQLIDLMDSSSSDDDEDAGTMKEPAGNK